MEKGLIYIQKGFWSSIVKDRNRPDRIAAFGSLYGALRKNIILTDIPSADIAEDPLLYYLCQDSSEGNGSKPKQVKPSEIENALDSTKHQPINNLTAVFLLDENTMMCDGYAKRLGVLCLNSDLVYLEDKFLKDNPIEHYMGDVESVPFSTCRDLFRAPCNSVVIIDPYILLDESRYSAIEIIDMNLIPLLDSILPDSIDIEGGLHISIFSQPLNSKCGIEEIYSHIQCELEKIRPKLVVDISIFHVNTSGNGKGDFHNRFVLTNSLFIKCGNGFAAYEKEGQRFRCRKTDTINVLFPALSGNRVEYNQWIEICSELNKKEGPLKGRGNRLFELA